MSEKMRKLWSFEPCEECGAEGYATRTETRPVSDRYICDECETWGRAESQFGDELDKARARIAELERDLDEIANWREVADMRDLECGHPQREYCKDVRLIEQVATAALRGERSDDGKE